MKAFTIHFLFNLKSGLRDKTLLLMNYLFPLGFFLIIGSVMPALNPTYKAILIPSMMIFSILVSTVLGMPNELVTFRNTGIYRSYKINGVSKFSILAIPVISTIFHTIVVTLVILISSPILFKTKLPANMWGLVIVFICMAIASSGLAVLIGVIADNTSVTVIYAQLIFLPSMLIGGLMFPVQDLPSSLSKFSKLLPTTYAMDLFQAIATNGKAIFSPWISGGVLTLSGVISFLLAGYLFRVDNNSSKGRNRLFALLVLVPFILVGIFL